jgi:hypothetical protein
MLHEIPRDDGTPHAPTGECGCGPELRTVTYNGTDRLALVHHDQTADGDARQEGHDHAATRP